MPSGWVPPLKLDSAKKKESENVGSEKSEQEKLEAYRLETKHLMNETLQALMKHKPSDPEAFLSDFFLEKLVGLEDAEGMSDEEVLKDIMKAAKKHDIKGLDLLKIAMAKVEEEELANEKKK